jgi:class 3 adenylate cyclase
MIPDDVRMNRLTLEFEDPHLERQFLDAYADGVRVQVRGTWIAAIVVLLAFTGLEPAGEVGFYLRAVRCGLGIPAALLQIGITFTSPKTFRRVWAATNCAAAGAILSTVPLCTFVASARVPEWRLQEDVWSFGFAVVAMVLTVLATHSVGAARFFQATLTTTAFALFWLVSLIAVGMGARAILFDAIATGCATLFGAFGSYRFEASRRRLFLDHRQLEEQHQRLAEERAKSESLLRNILPTEIAERLKIAPSHIADRFDEVTILFADIVGFTELSSRLSPPELVAMLNRLFTAFDDLAEQHELEKIKTIGDAYMVVGGLPKARDDHAHAVIAMALSMRDAVSEVARQSGHPLAVRIGANTGPVVAGVIGKKKFAYDLWGDAVNTASRMESHGVPGEIQISASTRARVEGAFDLEARGVIQVKGKGELETWWVRGPKPAPGSDLRGTPDGIRSPAGPASK